jgi:PAS fold
MQRFILQSNIARYRQLLDTERDERFRGMLRELLCSATRDLALLNAAERGARGRIRPVRFGKTHTLRDPLVSLFQRELECQTARKRDPGSACKIPCRFTLEGADRLYLVMDPRPGLHVVDINNAYAAATMTTATGIAGRPMFEIFPDNPDEPLADGVCNLYASLATAADTGRPHTMPVQRYDIRDAGGKFVERHWQPVNTPLFDAEGNLAFLLHHVVDVTAKARASKFGEAD